MPEAINTGVPLPMLRYTRKVLSAFALTHVRLTLLPFQAPFSPVGAAGRTETWAVPWTVPTFATTVPLPLTVLLDANEPLDAPIVPGVPVLIDQLSWSAA